MSFLRPSTTFFHVPRFRWLASAKTTYGGVRWARSFRVRSFHRRCRCGAKPKPFGTISTSTASATRGAVRRASELRVREGLAPAVTRMSCMFTLHSSRWQPRRARRAPGGTFAEQKGPEGNRSGDLTT